MNAPVQAGAYLAVDTVIWYFFLYAFLGWVAEVVYAAFETQKLVNRGFLNGPICPIYGFGMLALLALMDLAGQSIVIQFLVGMAVTTAIELLGGWVLYKLFHTRWWDYTMFRFNLGGYICLRFSLLWGVASVVAVRLIHPLVESVTALVLGHLPPVAAMAGTEVLVMLFGADIALSAAAAVGLNKRLAQIDALRGRLRIFSDKLSQVIGSNAMELDELLDERALQMRLAAMEGRDNAAAMAAQLREMAQQARAALGGQDRATGRLLSAFPQMHSPHGEALTALRRALSRPRRGERR